MTETEQIDATEVQGQGQGSDSEAAPPETAARADGAAPGEGDLAALVAERDAYLDQLQRSRADFANYRRRVEQERAQVRQIVGRDLLLQVLPVLDDFRRALASVPADQAATGWVAGTAMIEKKLAGILERSGATEIEALGQPFDPALHEAVATDPGSSGEVVVEVYQPGFRLGESVLRPAMVKTGSAPVA